MRGSVSPASHGPFGSSGDVGAQRVGEVRPRFHLSHSDALASAEALANDRCAPRCAARAARESSERRQSGTYCSGRRIRRGWIMRASNVINSGRRLVRRPSSERLLDAGRWMATSPFAVGRSASAALAAVGRNVRGVGVGAASTRHPRPRLLRPYNADSMSPTRSTKRRRRPLR